MQTESKYQKNEDLYSYAYPKFFFHNFQNNSKMRFLALVKHYIINLEFLNSSFCSHKGPKES